MAKNTEETEQLLLRPKKSRVKRLRELAETYGYGSGNEVAVEILDHYTEFWAEVKEIEARARDEQRVRALGKEMAPARTTARRARKVA